MVSKYNPYSIDNIKHYILQNNLKCIIKSNDYKDANKELKFECDCGKAYKTKWRIFMSYHNDRCSTCSKKQSQYALKMEEYLIKNNLKYEKEYKYKDCRDIKILSFDFIVFNNKENILIEVDGETHFIPSWGGIDSLISQQRRDDIKNQYCKNNNIKLIRVSYIEINNESYLIKLKKELLNTLG